MLKEQAWKWDHGGDEWELLVEHNHGLHYIWLTVNDVSAATVRATPSKPYPVDLCCRRYEPWPEDVQRQFDEVVKAAIKAVR